MLIARIYVNEQQIDSLYIHNISGDRDGECEYEIVGRKDLGIIKHYYHDGYKPLLEEALRRIHNSDNKDSIGHDIDLWNSIAIFERSDGVNGADSPGWAHGILVTDTDAQQS